MLIMDREVLRCIFMHLTNLPLMEARTGSDALAYFF